jgi:hypothetical protein
MSSRPPGVDVMIIIFCHFHQFSAKKWRFSKKTPQCYDALFAEFGSVLRQKRQFFFADFLYILEYF